MSGDTRILLYNSKVPNNNFHLMVGLARALDALPDVGCRVAHPSTLGLWLHSFRPNAVVAFGGEEIYHATCRQLEPLKRDSGVPWALWTTEDPFETEMTRAIAPFFDLVLTTDAGSLDAYRHRNRHLLPLAADPVFHRHPVRTSDEEALYDLLFVGTAWPNRIGFLGELKRILDQRGFRTRFLMPTNPGVPQEGLADLGLPFERNVRIAPKDLSELQNRSRFALTLFRDFSRHTERPLPQTSPTNRFYETALAGTGQIIASSAFDLARFHPEIAPYIPQPNTVDEIVAVLEQDRRAPSVRDRAAYALQEFVEGSHLYHHRAQELMRLLGLGPAMGVTAS